MNKKLRGIIFVLALLQTVFVSAACAQEDPISSNQEAASVSYEKNLKRWQGLSEGERQAIRQKVRAMDAAQKKTIFENAGKFNRLPGEEQTRIRKNFRDFSKLSPDTRREIKTRFRDFQKMPFGKRQGLRKKFRKEKPEAARSFMNERTGAGDDKRVRSTGGDSFGNTPNHKPLRPHGGPGMDRQSPQGKGPRPADNKRFAGRQDAGKRPAPGMGHDAGREQGPADRKNRGLNRGQDIRQGTDMKNGAGIKTPERKTPGGGVRRGNGERKKTR